MARQKKQQSDGTRLYGQNKQPKNLRFTPETIRKLKQASAQEGVSETVYVELALKAQFKKDQIE
jgi:hypothetical protein